MVATAGIINESAIREPESREGKNHKSRPEEVSTEAEPHNTESEE